MPFSESYWIVIVLVILLLVVAIALRPKSRHKRRRKAVQKRDVVHMVLVPFLAMVVVGALVSAYMFIKEGRL